jgi:GNAT superfamily N-acetyltransferase
VETQNLNLDSLSFFPVTPERWADFESLFGKRGACGGCWCMYWRLKRSEFEQMKGDVNRQMMQSLVASGEVPGILGYAGDKPVGWVSIGPRRNFSTLERSRILKPVDDQEVWSVVCFFVDKLYRRQGLTVHLLRAAVDYARQCGAKIVEGYPYNQAGGISPDPFVYTGLLPAFQRAGFSEALRRSPTRPIVRYTIDEE